MVWTLNVAIIYVILSCGRLQALHPLRFYELVDEPNAICMFSDVSALGVAHCLQLRPLSVFLFLWVNSLYVDVLHSEATMLPHLISFQWVFAFVRELWPCLLVSEPTRCGLALRILLSLRDCLCKLFDLLVPGVGFAAPLL